MEKENARKQTLEQLYERRKQVVRLHKKAMGVMQIVSMTGLSYGGCQASCRKKFYAQAIFLVSWFCFFCVSGLRWTSAIRSQLRVGPDQRFGLASRAAAYTLARSSRRA